MAWSQATFVSSFDAEVGGLSTLADATAKTLWFNEGQARLLRYRPVADTLEWDAADLFVDLPSGFVQLDHIVVDVGTTKEPWRVFGQQLVMDDPDGACGDGTARIFYWGDWPALSGAAASVIGAQADYACLHYALSRFYKLLSSNRAYYKRYATLVGQNAVPIDALQDEADRHYQDFLDARADLPPDPPSFFFQD